MKSTFNFEHDQRDRQDREGRTGPEPVRPDPAAAGPTLADLPLGREAIVLAVDDGDPVGRRLLDLGLLPRTPVRAVRRAPLGDPTVYEFRGTRLCLRRSEARRVRVSPAAGRGGEESGRG